MEFHPFIAHGISPECGASDIRHKSNKNEIQSLCQEKLYSTVTLYSDQPTHGIAPECGIHLPGGNKSKFHYVFEIMKNELE